MVAERIEPRLGDPSWHPVDLSAVLASGYRPVSPEIGARRDGLCLFYRGKTHTIASEPEAGKSWLGLHVAAQQIRLGRNVVYIDYEDDVASVVDRLRALGEDKDRLLEHFFYIQPQAPMGVAGRVHGLMEPLEPSLVIIDGVTEAMTVEGLGLIDNQDVAEFNKRLPGPMSQIPSRPAVVSLDHVVKKRGDGDRHAIGAQHKLAAVSGAAFKLDNVQPFAVGALGMSTVRVVKDRPGQVRRHCIDRDVVGMFTIISSDDTSVDAVINVEAFRPASIASKKQAYIRRIVDTLAEHPDGLRTKGDVKARVRGNSSEVGAALNALIEKGYVSETPYRLVKPFEMTPS